MKSKAIANLLFLALSWCVFASDTRAETLPFKTYTTSDGLAHDHVTRIVRDSRGFLWFCTSEGLSRFDGYEFKNYTQEDGLPHRAINDILETHDGQFWVATNDGLVFFDPLGVSKRMLTSEGDANRPMFRTLRPQDSTVRPGTWDVSDLIETRDGEVWVGSITGLFRLAKGSNDWELHHFKIYDHPDDQGEIFTHLLEDHTGAIWAGNEAGIYRISPDRTEAKLINDKFRVESILEDRDGHVWVGNGGGGEAGKGLILYAFTGDEPHLERIFGKNDGLFSDYWMFALLETSDGRILVGNGLCEYTPQADSSQPQFRALLSESVSSLGEDAAGNVWVGTPSGGVKRISRNGFTSFDQTDGLKSKSVPSIIVDNEGDVYLSSSQYTISRFNGRGFVTIAPFAMIPRNWGTAQVIFRDSRGEWWVDGYLGLQRYPRTARFEDLAHTPPLKTYTTGDGLFSNGIFRLFEDSRGDVWISCIDNIENTLTRWERSTESFHPYTTADGLPRRNAPTAIGEDRAGNIWAGYYGGGLVRFHNGRFQAFDKEDGLPPDFIYSIFTDSVGRLWVATAASGVLRIDDPTSEEKPRLQAISRSDGLSSNQAMCVTEDNFGRIYIGTGRGVDRLDLASGRIKVFTKADGLPENLVRYCRRDASGALWFGMINGVARYIPEADERTPPPPAFIASVRANGDPIKKLSELGETSVQDLDLASDQRQVQIEFFALGFSTGETLRYQYKLDGGNDDWSQPAAQRTVNLDLSPGGHSFLVRAVTADGVLSEQPATVSISIARPLWQRWWFLLLLTLTFAGLVYLLYRYRLRRLLELEKVRTRIATDLHDDIGSSLSQIAILSEVVRQKVGGGPVDQPLTMIADTSREMVDSMSDIVWAIDPNKDHLSDLVQRMRRFASDILDAREISYRFQGDERHREVSLGADVRREVYLIFKECVNNLVKHADATDVQMSVQVENRVLVVTIKDNGKGFDAAAMLDRNGYDGLGGNGLRNIRSRVANLGGQLMITSELGKGTLIDMRIPVRKTSPLAT